MSRVVAGVLKRARPPVLLPTTAPPFTPTWPTMALSDWISPSGRSTGCRWRSQGLAPARCSGRTIPGVVHTHSGKRITGTRPINFSRDSLRRMQRPIWRLKRNTGNICTHCCPVNYGVISIAYISTCPSTWSFVEKFFQVISQKTIHRQKKIMG